MQITVLFWINQFYLSKVIEAARIHSNPDHAVRPEGARHHMRHARKMQFFQEPNSSQRAGSLDQEPGFAAEPLIAASRFVLAIGGLLAIYLDPAQPSQGTYGYAFLGGYVI
jgi:hypothetical protein